MSITVTGYQLGLFGNRRLVREAEGYARGAAPLVTQAVGQLPGSVTITLTNERAMITLSTRADASFAPGASGLVKVWKTHQQRRHGQGAFGVTSLDPRGGIAIGISVTAATTAPDLAETILHEMVHAAQLNAPGAREMHIRHLRHCYRIEPWSRRDAADYDAVIDRREAEARALEPFAARLLR
ncbi:hypothetical protein RVR_P181 (plasmid) [Actinacidiphila reveromycinica]|uniref:Uncharacterized protein n=1 Tax=Actinacidiphila reveromycinica TaxID=659352 RepID=A0A7U3QW19_9ACTN|nr:hypothetical protein [Streptomyces sp. SN-593]BBG20699.1 hypothetical protein RVR_P181 [Streptomyces sp. SN-593]